MKSLITTLVLVLVAHVLCSGSCISQSFKTTEAPCHKQQENSGSSPQQSQESGNLCVQGTLTDYKSSAGSNHLLSLTAVLPESPFLPAMINPFLWLETSDKASGTSILYSTSTILRI
jgi:hypothetical protein